MKLPWFKQFGILFIPVSLTGWVIFFCGIALLVYTFIDIDSRSHSASDTLMNFAFYLLIIGAVYSLIGLIASRSYRHDADGKKREK
jgi:hypothetical protein